MHWVVYESVCGQFNSWTGVNQCMDVHAIPTLLCLMLGYWLVCEFLAWKDKKITKHPAAQHKTTAATLWANHPSKRFTCHPTAQHETTATLLGWLAHRVVAAQQLPPCEEINNTQQPSMKQLMCEPVLWYGMAGQVPQLGCSKLELHVE